MSATADDIFRAADEDIFEVFGQDATVKRGTDAEVPVRVVVERGVKKYGEYGQLVSNVDQVSFRVPQWQPKQDDVVSLGAVDRRIDRIESDDGVVAVVVLYG